MLPSLKKINQKQKSTTQAKLYSPTLRQNTNDRKDLDKQFKANTKSKIGGGFRISNNNDEPKTVQQRKTIYPNKTVTYVHKKSSNDINLELREIQKKIKQCQKKIEVDKRRKQQQEDQRNYHYGQDFQKIIKKQLQLQGYIEKENQGKNFDYLTNPGGVPVEEQQAEQVQQEVLYVQPKPYDINQNVQKLEKYYEHSLKKKFERRQIFPHKACRRKTPKLYITQKTNAVNKYGKPITQQEHRFRVMTKEVTPQQINPVIPNFAVVKDNLSKNIVAYLGDYKPFLDKTKEKVEKELKNTQEIAIDNKSIAQVSYA